MNGVVENLRGVSVLVTGHTGFKGAWLCRWLELLGARVHGLSLPSPMGALHSILSPSFQQSFGDVRDSDFLGRTLSQHPPELVFHLAAQPLVRESYKAPGETFDVNVRGTWTLLDAVDRCRLSPRIVIVTTDKVYRNDENGIPFREDDPLGGNDPYSASKACVELVVQSWRTSFWSDEGKPRIATARSGNVLGGGDRGADRIIPDAIAAHTSDEALQVRNPASRRPWLHVLESLWGYLLLGGRLMDDPSAASSWNFAPSARDALSVAELLQAVAEELPGFRWETDGRIHPPEAALLRLDGGKAASRLGWNPVWDTRERVRKTFEWERAWMLHRKVACDEQIRGFQEIVR